MEHYIEIGITYVMLSNSQFHDYYYSRSGINTLADIHRTEFCESACALTVLYPL